MRELAKDDHRRAKPGPVVARVVRLSELGTEVDNALLETGSTDDFWKTCKAAFQRGELIILDDRLLVETINLN